MHTHRLACVCPILAVLHFGGTGAQVVLTFGVICPKTQVFMAECESTIQYSIYLLHILLCQEFDRLQQQGWMLRLCIPECTKTVGLETQAKNLACGPA